MANRVRPFRYRPDETIPPHTEGARVVSQPPDGATSLSEGNTPKTSPTEKNKPDDQDFLMEYRQQLEREGRFQLPSASAAPRRASWTAENSIAVGNLYTAGG